MRLRLQVAPSPTRCIVLTLEGISNVNTLNLTIVQVISELERLPKTLRMLIPLHALDQHLRQMWPLERIDSLLPAIYISDWYERLAYLLNLLSPVRSAMLWSTPEPVSFPLIVAL